MKKKWIIFSLVALIFLIVAITIFFIFQNRDKTFSLEKKYYGTSNIIEIDADELENLVNSKESFAVFVYQTMCMTSSNFETVLNEFLDEYPLTIYKIAFSDLSETALGKDIEYYPSFIIYKDGKMIDFLKADEDEDLNYYKSKDNFKKWFTKYVNLNNVNKNQDLSNTNDSTNKNNIDSESSNDETNISNIDLSYITKEEGKVNIYFFWGDGCPHCKEQFAFLESIENEYGDQYNLYTFETWKSEENQELLNIFAEATGVEARGVPYTVIGQKVLTGFSEYKKEEIISAIKSESQNDYDVYFDKIVGK